MSFNNLFVNNNQGAAIPIGQIAHLVLESSPFYFDHFNKTRTVSVTAFIQEGYLADRIINEVGAKVENLMLP